MAARRAREWSWDGPARAMCPYFIMPKKQHVKTYRYIEHEIQACISKTKTKVLDSFKKLNG